MGFWTTASGMTIGDHPADLLDKALDQIVADYVAGLGRPPTYGELCALIEFCMPGVTARCPGLEREPHVDAEVVARAYVPED